MLRRPGANRRGLRGFGARAAAAVVPLEAQILAALTAGGWTTHGLFLARAADVSLVSGKVATWANLGTGSDATQGTDAARPTWDDDGLNSLPTLAIDGGDSLTTGLLDTGSDAAYALIALFRDTDTASRFVCEWGALATDKSLTLNVNAGGAGDLDIYADGTGGAGTTTSRARSVATTYPMTTPAVVTGTWDSGLASSETQIRHAGSDVTNSRPNDGNSTEGLGSQSLIIGARKGPAGNLTGAISAIVAVSRAAGPITGDALTAISTVESLLATAWGL